MTLRVRDLVVDVAKLTILKGITLEVPSRAIVSVLGPNGAGKTTLLKTISGIYPSRAGQIEFSGARINGTPAPEIARGGIGHVSQDRDLFSDLSVRENLEIGALGSGKWRRTDERLALVFDYFPVLKQRQRQIAETLSGGEQRMLAIGRALMACPQLLMLDEPSAGLAPRIVEGLGELVSKLRRDGLTILLVEQNLTLAMAVSDYVHVLASGEIRTHGPREDARRWNFASLYLGNTSGAS